jgi:hypothetical protein
VKAKNGNARSDVWPTNKVPSKEAIERMYKCAYYVDRNFFRPADLVDFGLDLYRLKECGEVEMKKPLDKLRAHVGSLWERMRPAQKTMYLYSYLCQTTAQGKAILRDLGAVVGDVAREIGFLEGIPHSVYIKFPKELQDRIQAGFGKEWGLE